MHALHIVAEVSHHAEDGKRFNRDFRVRAEALLAAKAEFSVRLRTYIRVGGVGISNNAKIGWEKMAEECEQANSISGERVSEACSTVQAYMDRIT